MQAKMMAYLLAERKQKVHFEQSKKPTYSLVIPDGKGQFGFDDAPG